MAPTPLAQSPTNDEALLHSAGTRSMPPPSAQHAPSSSRRARLLPTNDTPFSTQAAAKAKLVLVREERVAEAEALGDGGAHIRAGVRVCEAGGRLQLQHRAGLR
ncbi:MAG: hypothetical protein ACPIOQ_48190 [Promethearchaeia archaeon]